MSRSAPKSAVVYVYLEPVDHGALQRAAESDGRSLSDKAGVILRDWLKRKGYLPGPKSA